MAELRVALVGYGMAGRDFHAPLLRQVDGLRVTTSSPAIRSVPRPAKDENPGARVLPTVEEIWALSGQIDVVVLASPTNVHAQQAREALRRDLAGGRRQADGRDRRRCPRARELAEARGVLLTVFQNRRWSSDHLTYSGRAVLRGPWRAGALRGALRAVAAGAQGSLARALHQRGRRRRADGPPVAPGRRRAWTCSGRPSRSTPSWPAITTVGDDVSFVVIKHLSGLTSHLGATSLAGAPGPRTRLLGRDGTYLVADIDG
jgi:hypothetical protein